MQQCFPGALLAAEEFMSYRPLRISSEGHSAAFGIEGMVGFSRATNRPRVGAVGLSGRSICRFALRSLFPRKVASGRGMLPLNYGNDAVLSGL